MSDTLGNALIDSATSDTIKDLAADMLELGADALTDNEALKAIPVFGTALKLFKGFSSYRDYLFMKVIYHFLFAYSKVSDGKRTEFLIKIEDEPEFKSKVGEKLIFILNRVDDIDKAEVLGNLFKAYVEGAFNLTVFYRLAGIVDKVFIQDIHGYVEDKHRAKLRNNHFESLEDIKKNMELNEKYKPLGKYNLFHLANAGFFNSSIRSSDDYYDEDNGENFIGYSLNVYSALIMKFAFGVETSALYNLRQSIPEF